MSENTPGVEINRDDDLQAVAGQREREQPLGALQAVEDRVAVLLQWEQRLAPLDELGLALPADRAEAARAVVAQACGGLECLLGAGAA